MKVRTRIAPSPTGYGHIGLLSRILANYAYAKKHGGEFIWRNEDTDQTRFVPGSMEFTMKWVRQYGLDWDEGPDKGGQYAPYNQTERLEYYNQCVQTLLENGHAYRCFCTKERLEKMREEQRITKQRPHYDGTCRNLTEEQIQEKLSNREPYTIRIKMPRDHRKITFEDMITENTIAWDSNDIDDYIIVKSNGIPTYHLAAIADDIAMQISHVARGAEWIATTPVHLMIYEGLGVTKENMPKIGHFTVINDPNTPGKKFSKRNSAFKINGLLIGGYLKEAVLNYLMLLGWAPKDNQEIFSLQEYIQAFDFKDMGKANPTWDNKKLDWFNGVYIRKLSIEELKLRFFYWLETYLHTASAEDLSSVYTQDGIELEDFDRLLTFSKSILSQKQDNEFDQKLDQIVHLIQERVVNFWDVLEQIEFVFSRPQNINFDIKQLQGVLDKKEVVLLEISKLIESFDEDSSRWAQEEWEAGMRAIGDKFEVKHGDVFMLCRVAVVGSPFSPPLLESLQVLGKSEVLERLEGGRQ